MNLGATRKRRAAVDEQTETPRRCGAATIGAILPSPTHSRMRTRFVLIQTSHAGNVGGVARAMQRQIQKTFPDFELPLIKQLEALHELQSKL